MSPAADDEYTRILGYAAEALCSASYSRAATIFASLLTGLRACRLSLNRKRPRPQAWPPKKTPHFCTLSLV
jgi:hypothetical protein